MRHLPPSAITIVSVADKTITCRDCGQQFVFSANEQSFFAERGFSDPVRCLPCRRALKARKAEAAGGVPSEPRQPARQEISAPSHNERNGFSDSPSYSNRPATGDGGSRGSRNQASSRSGQGERQDDWDGGFGNERRSKPKRPPRWIEADPDPEDEY